MAYEAMNTANGKREEGKAVPRSTFQDRALLLFYVVVIAVSMGGWLWLLMYLSWRLVS
jgi:hypothetical protein